MKIKKFIKNECFRMNKLLKKIGKKNMHLLPF